MNQIDNRQIRVFISSTFQDMQDERDELMKKTFPMLRQMAAERDVTLTEIDLRWGITEDESKSGKVVEICLREIENSVPFFIGIIGNRYGWIPKPEDIGGSLTERFPDVPKYVEQHLSVTEMEMQFGVLARQEDMHAYFFIKEPEIPDKEEPEKLDALKRAVRANKRYPVSTYSSREDLARQVEEAFRKLLDDLFPAGALSALEKERLGQRAYMNSLCQIYIRTEKNFAAIDEWMKDWEKHQLVITGASGLGKSALVANWTKDKLTKEKDLPYKIIYHAVGSGGSLGSDWHVVKSLCDEIRDLYGFDTDEASSTFETSPKTDEKELKELFDRVAFEGDKPLLIVLDAINQVVDVNHAKRLNWLPIPPKNVKILFTTLEDDETMQVFQDRHYPVYTLQPLTREERIQMVYEYLSIFSKKLKPEQVARIVDDRQSDNTLVMKTLLDELVNFGIYERLDEKIEEFLEPDSYEDFYQVLLQNYEASFKEPLVRHFLSLIAVSRKGLSEDEILSIMQVKPLHWSQFFCSFRQHLIVKNGLVSFSHSYIREAVEGRYIKGSEEWEHSCREEIVAAVIDQKTPEGKKTKRSMDEVPYQLDLLGVIERLHDYLIDLEVFSYLYKNEKTTLGKYWWRLMGGGYSIKEYLPLIYSSVDQTFVSLLKELRDFNEMMRFDDDLFTVLEEQVLQFELQSLLDEYQKRFGKSHQFASVFYKNRWLFINENEDLFLCNFGDVGKLANEFALRSLEIRQELYGENHADVAMSYDNIYKVRKLIVKSPLWEDEYVRGKATMFDYDDTRYEKECKLKALAIRRNLYGENHPIVAASFNAIFDIDYKLKALEIWHNLYGEIHPDIASCYFSIGEVYSQGKYKQYKRAIEYYSKALEMRKYLYGDIHPDTASCYSKIGNCYFSLHQYNNSLEYLFKDLEISRCLFGDYNLHVAISCETIAWCFLSLNNLKKAVEYKLKYYDIRRELFHENYPLVGITADDYLSIFDGEDPGPGFFFSDDDEYGSDIWLPSLGSFFQIPDSVTEIGESAFENYSCLQKIHLPNSITKISQYAFKGCTGLTEIHIPNSVTIIGSGAFSGCSSLKTISIPKDLNISILELPDGVQIVRRS